MNTAISLANLHEADGKTVHLPAMVGRHIGRGFRVFGLKSLSSPGQVGNDAFTEVYFRTGNGNAYRISRPCTGSWVLVNVREMKWDKKSGYEFPIAEIDCAVLEVGKQFYFGHNDNTTMITAIVAVNASRCYREVPSEALECDIRNEFTRLCSQS